MSGTPPILIKQRQIDEDELRKMLIAARASGDTLNFFRHFGYQGQPHETLAFGEELLRKCKLLEPTIYETLLKGTPFYWLAHAAFQVADYERRVLYRRGRLRRYSI